MAVALQQEPIESAAEILAALERARTRPYPALRHAVERANEIAPAVIDVVDQAARGVLLMPAQHNLLFWGIHAVAAARRAELYRPLLNWARQIRRDQLDRLLMAAVDRMLKKIVISIFDGDPEPLIAACADKNADGSVRWDLMLALARLTFDGRIPRDATHDFLDRFEREPLADPGDAAWEGWQDAITYLGFEEMRQRLRASWADGRNPHPQEEWENFERLIGIAQGLAPGDDSLFFEVDIVPLHDPVEELEWTTRVEYEPDQDVEDPNDPASAFTLKGFELDWLDEFLVSAKVPPATMTLQQVDGFFCALIAGPAGARPDDYLRAIWNADKSANDTPSYDSPQQERYVQALLRRHWTTISQRLEQAHPYVPVFAGGHDPWRGRAWTGAFLLGVEMREPDWSLRLSDQTIKTPLHIVLTLDMEPGRGKKTAPRSGKARATDRDAAQEIGGAPPCLEGA
jgi:uncharacterized protein